MSSPVAGCHRRAPCQDVRPTRGRVGAAGHHNAHMTSIDSGHGGPDPDEDAAIRSIAGHDCRGRAPRLAARHPGAARRASETPRDPSVPSCASTRTCLRTFATASSRRRARYPAWIRFSNGVAGDPAGPPAGSAGHGHQAARGAGHQGARVGSRRADPGLRAGQPSAVLHQDVQNYVAFSAGGDEEAAAAASSPISSRARRGSGACTSSRALLGRWSARTTC